MFDQASMVRGIIKLDCALRNPDQVEVVVDRAPTVAKNEPRGAVDLSLPREVLADGGGVAWGLVRLGRVAVNGVTPMRVSAAILADLCASAGENATISWIPNK